MKIEIFRPAFETIKKYYGNYTIGNLTDIEEYGFIITETTKEADIPIVTSTLDWDDDKKPKANLSAQKEILKHFIVGK